MYARSIAGHHYATPKVQVQVQVKTQIDFFSDKKQTFDPPQGPSINANTLSELKLEQKKRSISTLRGIPNFNKILQ